ncbi:related to ERG6 - Delta(24)-sterol C-methyltransferase [Ustilago trichophora]|uniref:Related to ERG6 - Delta(24)-sterol C-methyltransferase n=1 Tax=Ustilago trichophora TaxID=86804 RepID=A0A5C3E9J6_9BASI|nr:related to ERG6 - Delta(24)-sterol C-methyltransferase [Ustilago trichophora]
MSSQSGYHRSDNAEVYRSNASFVYSSAYTAAVLQLLGPKVGDRVVDLGCGSGELTIQVAHAVGATGSVLGIDASQDMIDKATTLLKASTSNLENLTFAAQDGHSAPLAEQHSAYDKVFSNAALHWMKRSPSLVLSNVFTMLKPGGRFAAELGGYMNCVGVRGHLHVALRKRGVDPEQFDPWFFPSVQEYTALLEEAGFAVESCELVPRMTPLPKQSGLKGWLKTFAGPFLNAIESEEERVQVIQEVEEAVRPDCYNANSGTWCVMYVRLRVLAHKPE